MDKGYSTRARMDIANHAVASARARIGAIEAEVAQARVQLSQGSQVHGEPTIAAAQAPRVSFAELPSLGTPGKVVSEQPSGILGIETVELSNGEGQARCGSHVGARTC